MAKENNISCAYCNVGFYRSPYKQSLSKSGLYFCSAEHRSLGSRADSNGSDRLFRTGPVPTTEKIATLLNCLSCNTEFKRTRTLLNFCSDLCKLEYRQNKIDKACNRCNEVKPLEAFAKAPSSIDGLNTFCKQCVKNYWNKWYSNSTDDKRASNNLTNKDWVKTEKGQQSLFRKRLKRYNLSESEFFSMVEACNGKCGICMDRDFEAIDHDHETGQVRGLLCKQCNMALGGFRDSIESLEAAITYLKKSQENIDT